MAEDHHHHGAAKPEPAFDRFDRLREEAYLRFRWTRQSVKVSILCMVVIPGVIYYGATLADARWKWRGALKEKPFPPFWDKKPESE